MRCTWWGQLDPTLSHRAHTGLEPELIVLFVTRETRKQTFRSYGQVLLG